MTPECSFPRCPHVVTGHNRADQPTCRDHAPVVVSGSWMGEGIHHAPEGDLS